MKDMDSQLDRIVWKRSRDEGPGDGVQHVILSDMCKMNGLDAEEVRRAVEKNPFLRMGSAKIKKGFIKEKIVESPAVEPEPVNRSIKAARKNRALFYKMGPASPMSALPTWLGMMTTGEDERVAAAPDHDETRVFSSQARTRKRLYGRHLPHELARNTKEMFPTSKIRKNFTSRVDRGKELPLGRDRVASSVQSWVQCMVEMDEELGFDTRMLEESGRWLAEECKNRELSLIADRVARRARSGEWSQNKMRDRLIVEVLHSTLGPLVYQTVVVPLIQKLESPNPLGVADAAERLGRLGDLRTVDPLVSALLGGTAESRVRIMEALGRLGDPRATPAVLKVLGSISSTDETIQAVKTLIAIDDPRSEGTLDELASRDDEVGALIRSSREPRMSNLDDDI